MVSAYESGKRQPALPTLSKLIEATGHTLTMALERSDESVRGLPAIPLGRRLRQHRQALLDAVAEVGGSNLRVFGGVTVARTDQTVMSTCSWTCRHLLVWATCAEQSRERKAMTLGEGDSLSRGGR